MIQRLLRPALTGLALVAVLYHFADVFFSLTGAMHHYTIHLGIVLAVVALNILVGAGQMPAGARRRALEATGIACLAAAVGCCAYLYIANASLEMSQPFLTDGQIAIGVALILAIFALNWVVWGAVLTMVCIAAALYLGFGQILPGPVRDLQLDPGVVVSNLAGMGSPRGVFMYIPLSADTILLLLVYGGLMAGTGVLDMFAELGKAIGNYFRGGVSLSCIAASTMIGMVTGQTVSCIALTGSMTIPTMIRGGFTREEAGAIEVMAANGSQLIPPIMGLGAFLMSVIIGMPYVDIARAAILPSALYIAILVIGVLMLIHASPRIPFVRQVVDWRRFWWIVPTILPSLAVVVALLSLRYSAGLAAFWGIAVLLGMSFLRPAEYRPSLKAVVDGLRDGVVAGAQLALILAAIGVIVQVLVTTGLGTQFSKLMIEASGQSLEIALVMAMAIALVVGMGLPTPAAYSLCTIIVIPPLIDMGMRPLVAHFFAFYFAVLSAITPPVAVGILMATRISRGSFAGTAIAAMKLGGVCLLLPFFLVAFPNALEFPNLSQETIFAALTICVGTAALGAAAYRHLFGALSRGAQALLYVDAFLVLAYLKLHHVWLAVLSLAIFVSFACYRWVGSRRMQPQAIT